MNQLLFQDYSAHSNVRPGVERTGLYFSRLEGKKLGIVSNQTSMLGKIHLLDSLFALGREVVEICKVFGPEHGFRGKGEDAVSIEDGVDPETGLPVISLYGQKHKPVAADLAGLDLLLFDIPDVGVRFYTYISTLFYVMQACAERDLDLLLLDRPNPNGFYADGPVLEPDFSSFEGLHRVPVVYGMTIGEYAQMVNGESWLGNGLTCKLTIIPCEHYTNHSRYKLPVPPSPNLPTMNAVFLYPSICFFEGTVISEGRGTDTPFEVFGHPDLPAEEYSFTPESIPGADSHPKLKGKLCHGKDLRYLREKAERQQGLDLSWLINAYQNFPDQDNFFTPFFDKLAGTAQLRQQIMEGLSEEKIRRSWAADLASFNKIRRKYLIYPE